MPSSNSTRPCPLARRRRAGQCRGPGRIDQASAGKRRAHRHAAHAVGRFLGRRCAARWCVAGRRAVLRQAYAGVSRAVRSSQQEGGVGAAAPSQEPTRQLLYQVAQAAAGHAGARRAARRLRAGCGTAQRSRTRPRARQRQRAQSRAAGHRRRRGQGRPAARSRTRSTCTCAPAREVAALQTQVDALGNVADTLGMMGLGVARGVVVQQRDALRDMVEWPARGRRRRAARYRRRTALRGCLAGRPGRPPGRVGRRRRRRCASSESQRTVEVAGAGSDRQFRRGARRLRRLRRNQLGPRRTGRSPAPAGRSRRCAAHAGTAAARRLPARRAPVRGDRTDRQAPRARRAAAGHAGRCDGQPRVLPRSPARTPPQSRRDPGHHPQQPGEPALLAVAGG